ncbi:hypothetical protein ACOSQ2_009786 [Xanthoceras sorbifolium]
MPSFPLYIRRRNLEPKSNTSIIVCKLKLKSGMQRGSVHFKVVAMVALCFFCFFFRAFVVEVEARSIRTGENVADAPHYSSDHQNHFFINKGDENFGEGDLISMDYSPARRKPPIHN